MASIGAKLGHPVHKLPVGSEDLIIPLAKVGVEIEVENVRRDNFPDQFNIYWERTEDHSLRNNGSEFITRGGLVGKDLVKAIKMACKTFVENNYSVGEPRAAIHLHIDMTDVNEDSETQLQNCVLAYILFERALFRYAGLHRESCGFCDPLRLSQRDFKTISQLLYKWNTVNRTIFTERNLSKYQAINFLPLNRQGTLEFRHLPTTFDSKRILEWINICLAFKAYGMNVNLDPVDLLERDGAQMLAQRVFGSSYAFISPHINEAEVFEAIADARMLRMQASGKKLVDGWNNPNNPLLLKKFEADKANPPKPKRKPTTRKEAVEIMFDEMHELNGDRRIFNRNIQEPAPQPIDNPILNDGFPRFLELGQLAALRGQARAGNRLAQGILTVRNLAW